MEIHGYTASGSIDATIDGVRMTVPDDTDNRHRRMIKEWEDEGNTIPAYQPPAPTAADVKAEAARRIEKIMPPWMIDRQVSGGNPIPEAIKDAAQAIRVRSDEIEAMDPIPADLRNDSYWD